MIPWPKYTTKRHFSEEDWHSDDFGVKEPRHSENSLAENALSLSQNAS